MQAGDVCISGLLHRRYLRDAKLVELNQLGLDLLLRHDEADLVSNLLHPVDTVALLNELEDQLLLLVLEHGLAARNLLQSLLGLKRVRGNVFPRRRHRIGNPLVGEVVVLVEPQLLLELVETLLLLRVLRNFVLLDPRQELVVLVFAVPMPLLHCL